MLIFSYRHQFFSLTAFAESLFPSDHSTFSWKVILTNKFISFVVSFTPIDMLLVLFSCSVVSNSLKPHGLQHARLPCPSPPCGAYSNTHPLSQWCHPTTSSSVIPFSSCLQSFPASGSFLMCQLFASGGQHIGASASASVFSMNIQDWFPLGQAGWISLQSKGLSESSPTPQFKSISSLALSLLYGPTLTSIHDYWKNHIFDYMDLCQQSNVSTS